MDRVYLLLRNNQQTGPFTIDELLQQQLQHSDMIWIEGRSNAWTYLYELELTPFIKKTEVVAHRPMKAEDEIEIKAEELRQRILASAPRSSLSPYVTEIERYASPYKSSDNQIEFVDIKKERRIKKNTALIEFLLTFFVAGLFMLGIYKGKSFLGARHELRNSMATELDSRDQHAAQKNKIVLKPNIVSIDTTRQADSLLAVQKAKQKPVVKKTIIDSTAINLHPVINPIVEEEKTTETAKVNVAEDDDTLKKNSSVKKEMSPSVTEIKTNDEPVKEEKKGFLKGLFKKKKKEDQN
jgi:hypothetical protein